MRKTHKLLAAMIWFGSAQASAETPRTLRSGAPACGNVMKGKGGSSSSRSSCTDSERAWYRAEREVDEAKRLFAVYKDHEVEAVRVVLTTPRVLANGAPACGNMLSKDSPSTCTQEIADQQDEQRRESMKQAFAATRKARARVHEAEQKLAAVAPALRGTELAQR